MKYDWPKAITKWIENRILYMSIPFTWLLNEAKSYAFQISYEYDKVIVGGPAVYLMPGYFKELSFVSEGYSYPGVLQRVNPLATRTSSGCINKCGFCGVPSIEPVFREFDDWPDRPVVCDNNILACSQSHFDKVCDRLEKHGWCDFNQGIDASLVNEYHIERFKRIGKPIVRLALDSKKERANWEITFDMLRFVGIAKRRILSYCLIGYNDDPEVAWSNCKFVEKHGVKALPMWYHELDAMEQNIITEKQAKNGWNDDERMAIMQWYYQHKNRKRG